MIVSRANDGNNAIYYKTEDHLGSSSAITNGAGVTILNSSFDAFGARRGANWQGAPSTGDWQAIASTTRHGFTDHNMLDNLGLIHMNGRVYDSVIGRFQSADPTIPDLYDSQTLNPYSYVNNNPLRYTDPSGYGPEDNTCQGICISFGFGYRYYYNPFAQLIRLIYHDLVTWTSNVPAMSLRQDSSANSPIAKQQASPHRTIPHGVDAKTLAPCDFGTGPDCLPEAPLGTSIIGVDDVLGRVVSAGLDAVGCSSNTCQFAAAVVLHKIPALKKPVGRSTADVATASDVAKNELRRPYIRNSTRDVVESRAPRDATGRPLDPNTGKPIEGRPDLGHKTGSEFRREKARANAEGVPAANKSVQSLVSKEESIYVVGLHGSCATC